jgi:predicted polyphosphate/ATP-dependent NAD kinase
VCSASAAREPPRSCSPTFQSAKALISERTDSEAKEEIAEDLLEAIEAEPDALFLLGPGSTVESIARRLGVAKTLLGIDAIAARRRVGTDLNERQTGSC